MSKYPEVYKVIGAPGTGKTTKVVGNPELELKGLFIEEMENGYALEDQMLVTYTNAGVDEAADRLEKMLTTPRYKIDKRVTTIHSQCFSTIGADREQTVDSYKKKQFCDKYEIEFGWGDDDDDIMANEDTKPGNLLFQIYDWLKSNRVEIEDWEECPVDWTAEEDPEYLMNQWNTYKAENNYIGFGDMIERVVQEGLRTLKDEGFVKGEITMDNEMEMLEDARNSFLRTPDQLRGRGPFVDTKVLYVDEVQDLTPLQWRWYMLQKLVAEKVYLGGDDDQSIYGWAGADPGFMLGEEGDFEVLDKTYRIPREVWEQCDNVIRQVDERQEKDVTPDGEGGEVARLKKPSARRIVEEIEDGGDAFVLFRARYMIDEFTKMLHRHGVPYENQSTFDTWGDDMMDIRNGLAKVEGYIDGDLTHDELSALKANVPDRNIKDESHRSKKRQAIDKLKGVDPEVARRTFELGGLRDGFSYQSWINAAEDYSDGINYYQKQALMGNLGSNRYDWDKDRVTVGTIHSAKGMERETVILATDTTKTIVTNMMQELKYEDKELVDSERRVYYVGMTRASEKLVLAEGLVNKDMKIPIETLLGEESKPVSSPQRPTR